MFGKRKPKTSTQITHRISTPDPHEKIAERATHDRDKAAIAHEAIRSEIQALLDTLRGIIGEADHHKDKSPDNEVSWRDITPTPGLVINTEKVPGAEIYTGSISTPIGGVTDYRVEADYVEFSGIIQENDGNSDVLVRFEAQCIPADQSHRSKENTAEFLLNMDRIRRLIQYYEDYRASRIQDVGMGAIKLAS